MVWRHGLATTDVCGRVIAHFYGWKRADGADGANALFVFSVDE